ncbi:MAG: hypothetical protein PHY73_05540 [Candidatus Omnitrophica bacterium]|nr:hypothetical protein [Candidatus Omnitrophota bacterium]
MKKIRIFIILFLVLIMSGCATTTQQVMTTQESQVMLRSMQTRVFDTTDRNMMLRTIIGTLQDLNFVIDSADEMLGTITATKYVYNSVLKSTVTVRPRGETQLLVRLNAQYGLKTVEDPETYQDFFTALEKAIFLTAHQVD